MVHGLLKRSLGPDLETADLVQEVFARLCDKIHTLESRLALRSFVFSIAVRVLREELRRRKLRSWLRLSSTGVLPESIGSTSTPEGREALLHFYAILDELGPLERTVFVLRFFEGSSLADIGNALGLSLATVKRRLKRGSDRVDLLMRRDPVLEGYPSRWVGGES